MTQLKEGQILKKTIHSQGKKGDGITKHGDYVIIVLNSRKGETHNIRITDIRTINKKYAYAEIIKENEK